MKSRLPHPFVLLLGGVAVAALLTWILPAGEYQRVPEASTGRNVVVPGTYHEVERNPIGPLATLVAVPRGIEAGADVIITILFVGGAFALLDATGVFTRLVGALVGRARRPRTMVIIVGTIFATLGALDNTHEEIVALIPVLLLLSRGLGFGAVTALAMSVGAAVVGAAFSPTNPFAAGIALRYAELPLVTSLGLRSVLLVAAVAIWLAWTVSQTARDDIRPDARMDAMAAPDARDAISLALVTVPIVVYVWGVLQLGWGFHELSGLFLVAGFAVGLVQRRSLEETTRGFLAGMDVMLSAALFVGVARAISVVLTDGRVMDTIVYGLVSPLEGLPPLLAATLMVPAQAVLHVPVVSNSGQAVLTMPIMAPMADLLGFSRDAAVMAFQTGAAMMDSLTPTNGALLAMLLKAGVPYGRWVRFALPGVLMLFGLGVVGIALTL